MSSELLRESTDSVLRAAEGIHQFCPPTYWGNPLADNFSIRPAEGVHWFCHRSYWGNPSLLSSDLLRESTRVYISYRWLSFKYKKTFRSSSLQLPSSWSPCSCHLPQGTSLDLATIGVGVKCEKGRKGISMELDQKVFLPMHAGTTALFPFPILPWTDLV